MELNRNQYFFAGILILLIGLQLRMVSSYQLTQEATRFLAEQSEPVATGPGPNVTFASATKAIGAPLPNKVIRPPEWIGWCMISVGSVLILHSLVMRKPG